MTYAIIKVINGSYSVHSEGFTDLSKAKVDYHGLCQTLWNAPDVITAEVKIVDENLDCVEDYKEYITHEPVYVAPEPEPTPEPEEDTEPTE